MQLDPLEFLVAFLPGESRRLSRTGVEIHCLQYWDDALAQWVGRGENIRVHYDPRDITIAYVRSPAGTVVRCKVMTPGIPAISLAEWQARRHHERSVAKDPARLAVQDASLQRADQLVSEAKASRRIRRRHATSAAGDVFRTASAPTCVPSNSEHGIPSVTPEPEDVISEITLFEVEDYE